MEIEESEEFDYGYFGWMVSLEGFSSYLETRKLTNIYPQPTASHLRSRCQKPRPQNHQEVKSEYNPLNGINECVISSPDGRKRVSTTDEWPYSVHGVITGRFTAADDTFQGTGILIGPNIVLTAGHNLFCYQKKLYVDSESMRFLPGVNGTDRPFGEVEVEAYFTNYHKDRNEDYAIIILKEPIGYMTGFFGLACLETKELASKKINIIGYPDDPEKPRLEKYEMWGMEGIVSRFDTQQGFFHYGIDTTQGQSGSGVFYEENGEYFIGGIHVRGDKKKKENTATLLTSSRYQQIYEWIQENVKREWLLYLRKGRSLGFRFHKVGVEEILLLSKYNLDELTILELGCKFIGDKGAKVLAQNASWIKLSQLDLALNNIGTEGAGTLAQNISWTNLVKLNLSFNEIGDQGAEALAQNASWVNLSKLDLSRNNIGEKGAEALAQNTSWANLAIFGLSDNKIGDKGAKGLAQNASWINLSHLHLSSNEIGAEGAEALAQNTSWTNLAIFDLSSNKIGDQGGEALAQNTSWTNLARLNLRCNNIRNKGAEALAQNTSWTNLARLSLRCNNIRNKGAEALARNSSWVNLSELDLTCNKIGDEGAVKIAQNASWINLSTLNLHYNYIDYRIYYRLVHDEAEFNLVQESFNDNHIEEGKLEVKLWDLDREEIRKLAKFLPFRIRPDGVPQKSIMSESSDNVPTASLSYFNINSSNASAIGGQPPSGHIYSRSS